MRRDKLPEIDAEQIACQQILEADHSVFSIQWIVIPGALPQSFSSATLLELYLNYIKRCTAGIIRPVQTAAGVEFRLLAGPLSLMQFLPPRQSRAANLEGTILNIAGGLLVDKHECDRGQLEFIVEQTITGNRLTLKLSDYCPLLLGSRHPSRWRKWLYRFTQAYIHKIVTVNFLARVYRQCTGKRLNRGVVHMVVRTGAAT